MSHKDALRLLFPIPLEGNFDGDLTVEGNALDAAQASADALLTEMFSNTTIMLLSSWERICGLTPGATDTIQMRQNRVIQQLRARGGLSRAYFIALAAATGFAITIDELRPLMAGIMRSGDTDYIVASIFCWRVNVSGYAVYYFRAGQSGAGEKLLWWPAQTALEDLFGRLKPAHTYLIFNYS